MALKHQDDLPVPSTHETEITRRHAAYLADPAAGTPWEEVKDRLLARAAAGEPTKRSVKRRRRL
ncbi:MAG: addiction module protein [Gemmatimonadota bacterium]